MRRTNGIGCVYKWPDSPVWWLKYSKRGRAFRESSHETDLRKAEKMLRKRLGELEAGTFAGPQIERIKVQELADDFIRDYRINGRKSLDDVQARWTLHLEPFFGLSAGRRCDKPADCSYTWTIARRKAPATQL